MNEYGELTTLHSYLTSDEFQKHVVAKIQDKLDKLKVAYECKTTEEIAEIRGQYEAYQQVMNFIDTQAIAEKVLYLKDEIEKLDKGV